MLHRTSSAAACAPAALAILAAMTGCGTSPLGSQDATNTPQATEASTILTEQPTSYVISAVEEDGAGAPWLLSVEPVDGALDATHRFVWDVGGAMLEGISHSVTFDEPGTYTVEVTVLDAADQVIQVLQTELDIQASPAAYEADAGEDQVVNENETVELDGGDSVLPDDETMSFQWHQSDGPTVKLSGADSIVVSFVAPTVDADTSLTFVLTVSAGEFASEDSVSVRVLDVPTTSDDDIISIASADPDDTTPEYIDPCAIDSDEDGVNDCEDACPDDPDKVAPGACGCGVAEPCVVETPTVTPSDPSPSSSSSPSPSCVVDGDCDDGNFCNGQETCNGGACENGVNPCSGQMCDESVNSCAECLVNSDCDDNVFCNGQETCNGGTCEAGNTPCPGQACNESTDACADCLIDGDCDDGDFCNGEETCSGGTCLAGSDPCPGQMCDEADDACANCLIDGDCDDGDFCNGEETCSGGTCLAGSDPCPGQMCDEAADACADCLIDGDCDDGDFCNGEETCSGGTCLAGSDPCPGQMCDEADDACADCLIDGDCDDGDFCNGEETCSGGTCLAGSDPCPGQMCDEADDACADCLIDGDCDDGDFCNGEETCSGGTCLAGSDPCPGQMCDEAADACADCLIDGDCDDGDFCNGEETCGDGVCEDGDPPFESELQVGSVLATSVIEASGLAASRQNPDVLWTHDDSGGDNVVFALNTSGTLLGTYGVGVGSVSDAEDIAIGPGPTPDVDYIYFGDIGDNNSVRSYIVVKRVPEPVVDAGQAYVSTTLTGAETIKLQYPTGVHAPALKDTECLFVDTNKDIYIVTKRMSPNKVYRAAYPQSTSAINTMEYVATLPASTGLYWITAGDLSADGAWLVVRNDQGTDYANVWYRAPGTTIAETLSDTPCVVRLHAEPQGEAIAWHPDGEGFYTVSEAHSSSEPLWFYPR